ncbi:ExeM/NucH family extracellular endonuclease [Luteimonas aestuarii]|nr:ExeM/NucH family extracellular endonuclease [Luteimonas aestuarii]
MSIGAVQGTGATSLHLGQAVTVEGVVTADMREGLGGWFVQDAGDGDPATSDGLFIAADGASIHARGEAGPLLAGDRVRAFGTVAELHAEGQSTRGTLTSLSNATLTVVAREARLPGAVAITTAPDDWERYEGMRVRIDAPLTISGHHDLARRGTLVASFDGRLHVPTEIAPPGDAARAVMADNARRRLLIDDGSDAERPETLWYLDGQPPPRSGSTITLAEGIVDQRHGQYRLQATAPLRIASAPRPEPPRVGGDTRIAAFNLENLFNGDGRGGGFPTARGARTLAEYEAQLARLVATIHALDPDIAALMELENDGFDRHSSIAQLVDALNAAGADWRYVDAGQGPGDDAIRVGLLYRAGHVRPVGRAATLEDGPFGPRSRAPLAQAFRRGDGPAFVVVANHFKSKGCSEAEGAERDQGDGQACWNALRTDSAQRLMAWLGTNPTGSGSDLVAIVGDLNAYAMEDPVQAFIAAGWVDAFLPAHGPAPHSYVFDGQAGRLDHALLSPALAARLVGAAKWHSNADEPQNVGYRGANGSDRPASPWRSSDHDSLVTGFRLATP